MPDYSKGKIYKITGGGLTYVGSTVDTLSRRLAGHRKFLKQYKKEGKTGGISSFQILEFPDCEITLIEDVPCERKEQLLRKERYWIENMVCVNKIHPLRTKQEYRKDNADQYKKKSKEYDTLNKDKIRARKQKYYLDNIEEKKKYYENNIEKKKERKKQFYENNKENILKDV